MNKLNILKCCVVCAMVMFSVNCTKNNTENSTKQTEDTTKTEGTADKTAENKVEVDENKFAVKTDAKPLSQDKNQAVATLLNKVDANMALVYGTTEITQEQKAEIKKYVEEKIFKGNKNLTQRQKFEAIYNWVINSIKYDYYPNDAYSVFTNRKAVCGGYSNITRAMLLSQDIPCLVVFGYLNNNKNAPIGAHAWNYAYVGGEWLVVDTTNYGYFPMRDFNRYTHLEPYDLDITLFKDSKFNYGYYYGLAVVAVNEKVADVSVPYSYEGYVVSSFYPRDGFAKEAKNLYVSSNINNMGENLFGLKQYCSSLENVFVKTDNLDFETYNGIVYFKNSNQPMYIPYQMQTVELKPMEKVEKNFIYDLPNVTKVVFPANCTLIESWAIENCPKLTHIVLPKSAKVEEHAFEKIGKDCKIEYLQ